MIVTIPPCEDCLKEIKDKEYFRTIFYLVKRGQDHKFNGYLKNETNIKLFIPENDNQKNSVLYMEKRYVGYMRYKYGRK